MNARDNTDCLLAADITLLVDVARQQVLDQVNADVPRIYWSVGRRLGAEGLDGRTPEDRALLLHSLAWQLERDYGPSFDVTNLQRMVQFARCFPDQAVVNALSQHLSWAHFKVLLALEDPFRRDFYAEMCRAERWSTRALERQIGARLFERCARAQRPELLVHEECDGAAASADSRPDVDVVLPDPGLSDFLGLQPVPHELGLETAILNELEHLLLDLNAGFSFIARRKRVHVDHRDHCIDLLFYNRRLRRLVAIDVRLGALEARHIGRMELYLRWLVRNEQEPGEESPLGITLCTSKTEEQIELLELDASGVHMADYVAVLPPREDFQARLHASMQHARELVLGRHGSGAAAH